MLHAETMAITIEGLVKAYDGQTLFQGLDLTLRRGEITGLLGPNGAGKTSLVEMIEGLRRPCAGSIRVLGVDPAAQAGRLQPKLGLLLQETAFTPELTARETLLLFSAFYVQARTPEALLAYVGLQACAHRQTQHLSGGQKQKLAIALALLNDPELVILDEPSTGLAPETRREIHDLIRQLRKEGRTVLLTTHYLEEAESLCDRILILKDGHIVADGSPAQLTAVRGAKSLLSLDVEGDLDEGPLLAGGAVRQEGPEGMRTYAVTDMTMAIKGLARALDSGTARLSGLHVQKLGLEDVYLELIGASVDAQV